MFENTAELGRWVRGVRKARGLTLAALGRQAGTGVRFLSEFERGKETAEVGRVLRVLKALGVPLVPGGSDAGLLRASADHALAAPAVPKGPAGGDAGRLLDMWRIARELESTLADASGVAHESVWRRAVERCTELLGEAARRTSATTRSRLPGIPWRVLVGWRNALVMHYDTVDHAALIADVRAELPRLLPRLADAASGGDRNTGQRDQ